MRLKKITIISKFWRLTLTEWWASVKPKSGCADLTLLAIDSAGTGTALTDNQSYATEAVIYRATTTEAMGM